VGLNPDKGSDVAMTSALVERNLQGNGEFAVGQAWPTDENGWVFFIASRDFEIPPGYRD
jgi:hypothetical protein